MSRGEGVGDRLRARAPAEVRAPAGVRARVERTVAMSEAGDERAATPGGRPGRAVGVVAVLAFVGAVGLFIALRPAGPGAAAPGVVAQSPGRPAGNPLIPRTVPVSNPLMDEAHRVWSDVQRLRSTVEGPVRTLAEAGRSL